ncbi:hypothetical protein Ava_1885 [Trichormus variabilis ATCC 29413]|uniref:Ice-binding protein C-terminal domain-containing protein n=2 Tax=Anabaena variabilis TaxID=264691 RepID=Q3MBX9_TRIV2|nr:hypothetical protein Ava_1885 [Trichormus variabilis ATCC 29413]
MVISKSNFLKGAVAALATVPVVAAGVFTSAGAAQAAQLVGEFSFSSDPTVSATLTSNSVSFVAPKTFTINQSLSTGNFTGFTSGTINNITSFSTNTIVNPFLTLLGGALSGSTFIANTASYDIRQAAPNLVAIDITTIGTFKNALTNEESDGEGVLTLQTGGRGLTAFDVETLLTGGGSVSTTFSGFYFGTPRVSTPEPATMLGLGLVGVGVAMSRRRKTVA